MSTVENVWDFYAEERIDEVLSDKTNREELLLHDIDKKFSRQWISHRTLKRFFARV